ncbi:MAG TPA: hypothetical protein VMK42_20245 [Anaeromyxobacteraceae bacterium]|nr:hypothetical protein [Anaeromyxobacteraceae bacterium]
MIELAEWVARRRGEAVRVRGPDPRGVTPSIRDLGAALRAGRQDLVGIPTLSPPHEGAGRDLAQRALSADVAALAFATGPAWGGSLAGMRAASEGLPATPILLLDPVVSEGQVLEGRLAGADAVTLPVAFLDKAELRRLAQAARSTLMTPVFLVRTPEEWERARDADSKFLLAALPSGDLAETAELLSRLPVRVPACVWANGLDTPRALASLAGRADGALLGLGFPVDAWPEVAVVEARP